MSQDFDFTSYNNIKRLSEEELVTLWEKYLNDRTDKASRDALIVQYIYLIRYVVGRVKVTLPTTISVEDIAITKKGQINSYGKSSPYIKFEAKIKKFPIGDIAGIVSVAKTGSGEERILISVNEKDKYSHLISEEFFKKIK